MNRTIETGSPSSDISRTFNIRDLQRIIRKRKLIIILSTLFFTIMSIYLASQRTPIYKAIASVELTGKIEDFTEFNPYKPYYELKTETMIIKSNPVISGAARELGLIDKDKEWEEISNSVQDMRIVKGLKSRIEARAREGAAIIDISVTSPIPEDACDMANSVANSYILHREQLIKGKDEYLERFYTRQRNTLQKELSKAKEEVTKFKQRHMIIDFSTEKEMTNSEVQRLVNELKQTDQQLKDIQQVKQSLVASSHPDIPSPFYLRSEEKGVVASALLNVHEGPGNKYPVVGVLEKGTTVEIMGSNDVWYQVMVDDTAMGWVSSYFIAPPGFVEEEVILDKEIHLRRRPSEDEEVDLTVPGGAKIRVLNQRRGWYLVSPPEWHWGWVPMPYLLTLLKNPPLPETHIDWRGPRSRVSMVIDFQDMEKRINAISKFFYLDKGFDEMGGSLLHLFTQRKELLTSYNINHPQVRNTGRRIYQSLDVLLDNIREVEYSLLDKRQDIHLGIKEAKHKSRKLLDKETEIFLLNSRVYLIEDMITSLDQRYQEKILVNAHRIEKVHLMDPAVIPETPINRFSYNIIFSGIFIGFLIGLGLAFVRESTDFSFNTIQEVETHLRNKVLGVIPHFEVDELVMHEMRKRGGNLDKSWFRDPRAPQMIVHFWPKSAISESFRSLRMSLDINVDGGSAKVIMLTSASPQEGKSFISSNLAIAFAQSGNRTLLIETDMRRPSFNKVFNIDKEPGLIDIIKGNTSIRESIQDISDLVVEGFDFDSIEYTPGLQNLYIIPAGTTPVHPTELLETLLKSDFFDEVKRDYDVVVMDSPAIIPVADSTVISKVADKVLMVYRMGKTPRDMIRRAYDTLDTVGVNVSGVVLSNVDMRLAMAYPKYYYRYYKYGYGKKHTRYYRFPYTFYYRLKKALGGYRFPSDYHRR